MKFLKPLLLTAILVVGATEARAFTSLQFSNEYVNGIASGFADESGNVSNGMLYGIIVSTNNSTFSAGQYDEMSSTLLANGGFLSIGGVLTDDYYHPGAGAGGTAIGGVGLTYNTSGDFEGNFTTPGGNGTIGLVSNVPIFPDQGLSPIAAGDPFSLIWFADNTAGAGDRYGMFGDPSFVMPASGTQDMSTPFVGTDPTRSAVNQFQAVPEPSRMLLLGLAMMGLIIRRRR